MALAMTACSAAPSADREDGARLAGVFSDTSDEVSDGAADQASDEVSSGSFEEYGDAAQCTEDCSGHDAGFEWAKEQGVTDRSECSGDSQSFIEGCEAFAQAIEERQQELINDPSERDESYYE